tara:strand:+ start:1522 stop:2190 length:669 start_codon:yes stop_codon:yes gene_type:complete
MGKIRNAIINDHLLASDNFKSVMDGLVELYATCPDASRVRFIQAIEDQLRINSPSRGRSASSAGGTGWRDVQKSLYAGRGAKWKSVPSDSSAYEALQTKLKEFAEDGISVDAYQGHTEAAGYAWIRYSGPRGTESEPMHAFEVRTKDSRIDHPKQLLLLNNDQAEELSTLSATPFSLGLENAQRRTSTPKPESKPEVATEEIEEPKAEIDVPSFDEDDLLDI